MSVIIRGQTYVCWKTQEAFNTSRGKNISVLIFPYFFILFHCLADFIEYLPLKYKSCTCLKFILVLVWCFHCSLRARIYTCYNNINNITRIIIYKSQVSGTYTHGGAQDGIIISGKSRTFSPYFGPVKNDIFLSKPARAGPFIVIYEYDAQIWNGCTTETGVLVDIAIPIIFFYFSPPVSSSEKPKNYDGEPSGDRNTLCIKIFIRRAESFTFKYRYFLIFQFLNSNQTGTTSKRNAFYRSILFGRRLFTYAGRSIIKKKLVPSFFYF